MKIIHPNENGITVIHPANCGLTLLEIALKDVPSGVPFLIVEDSDIPPDREFRAAWEADFRKPDGYGIGSEAQEDQIEDALVVEPGEINEKNYN